MSAVHEDLRLAQHLAKLAQDDITGAMSAGGMSYFDEQRNAVPYVELALEHLRKAVQVLNERLKRSP